MTIETRTPIDWTFAGALRTAFYRVVGAVRRMVEIYDEGRALQARTLASLDDDVLRNMGMDPAEVRFWRDAEKTLRPMDTEDLRRVA